MKITVESCDEFLVAVPQIFHRVKSVAYGSPKKKEKKGPYGSAANFSNKLSEIERNCSNATQDLARKVEKTENSFKFKGHQLQFELNSDILDNIGIAVDCIEHGRYTMAISVLQDSEKVLKKRNKLIHIANKSEGG